MNTTGRAVARIFSPISKREKDLDYWEDLWGYLLDPDTGVNTFVELLRSIAAWRNHDPRTHQDYWGEPGHDYRMIAAAVEAWIRTHERYSQKGFFLTDIRKLVSTDHKAYAFGVVLGVLRAYNWADDVGHPNHPVQEQMLEMWQRFLSEWNNVVIDDGKISKAFRGEMSAEIKRYVKGVGGRVASRRFEVLKVIESIHEIAGDGNLGRDSGTGLPLNVFLARELTASFFFTLSDGGRAQALILLKQDLLKV